ncbi:MAG TPA: type I polyketide synthase, partial [Pyrinomonadaceae bacterium]|nr:type I polyketide synthase [Pyrinomonadaceae bacterium]
YIEVALMASRELFGEGEIVFSDVVFPRVLMVHPRRSRKLQLVISREEGAAAKFRISSLAEGASEWTLHASGEVRCEREVGLGESRKPEEIVSQCHQLVSGADHYDELEQAGLRYGPAFRAVREVFVDGDTCIGRLQGSDDSSYAVLLDSGFQVLTRLRKGGSDVYLPVGVSELHLKAALPAGADHWGHGSLVKNDDAEVETDLSILTEDGSPVLELRGIRARRLAIDDYVASSLEISEWFHEIEWIERAVAPEQTGIARWIVFSDRTGVGDDLSSFIKQRGGDCVQVFAGSEYRNDSGKRFEVDPLNPKHFQRLFEDIRGGPLGIVHLWSLDVARNLSPNTLDEARKLTCGGLLHLIQALAGSEHSQRLWLVTSGSQAVETDDDVSGLGQSMLWGLGKVVGIEHSELKCTRIDLDPAAVETADLWNELHSNTNEEEIAFRHGSRFVSRLRRLPTPPEEPNATKLVRSDGLYLITGGLGGLGLCVSKWLVDHGARHLVLMSRSGASETTETAVESLRNAGAEVIILKTDVSVAEELAAALDAIEQMDAPLTGVIHAAGVLDDGLLLSLDWDRFERVTRPKIEGAWNLHHQLRDKQLDFFVLFSSAGSMLGAAGQANHVAGNSFLDALAHYRRACSLPALSINWSQWGDTGRVANSAESERLQLQGIPRLSNAQGLRALELLLGQPSAPPQVGVMKFDLEQWSRFYPQALDSSLLQNFARELPEQKTERSDITSKLQAAQTDRMRLALLEEFVRGEVAWVLRLSPKDIPSDTFFSDLALDSLRSLELRNRLEHGLNLTLPATLVWQFPTVDSLAPHLAEKLGLAPDDSIHQRIDTRVTEIERLSDAEAEVLLRNKLDSLQSLPQESLSHEEAQKAQNRIC